MKLDQIMRGVRPSKNGRRFFTSKEMSEAKRMESISNSQYKRGKIPQKHTHIVDCQCGAEGCLIVGSSTGSVNVNPKPFN